LRLCIGLIGVAQVDFWGDVEWVLVLECARCGGGPGGRDGDAGEGAGLHEVE